MILLRAAYGMIDRTEVVFGIAGSLGWSALAFVWGQNRVRTLMQNTRAPGGR
jgi:hypothetical protein